MPSEEDRIEVSSPPCSMPPVEGRVPAALVDGALKPLWACWRALFAARKKRGPLELDLPERQVVLDEKGRIASVAPRERLDAHRLVEDYMIAANVAAARALEAKKMPVMYRVHEAAEPRETGRAQGLSRDLRRRVHARPGGQSERPSTGSSSGSATATGAQRDHGAIAAHPDAGALRARAARPFRAGACDLCPFHLAHPPLCRPCSSIAGLVRAYALGEGGLAARRGGALHRDRRADFDARAARDGGRARDRRPLCRGLSVGPRRPTGRMPDHRRPELRLFRHGRGSGRRRPAVRARPRQ